MAYTDVNYASKAAVKRAIAAGERVTVHQPGPYGSQPVPDGRQSFEGPHYPQPHKWYGMGVVKDGALVSIT